MNGVQAIVCMTWIGYSNSQVLILRFGSRLIQYHQAEVSNQGGNEWQGSSDNQWKHCPVCRYQCKS